MTTFLNDDVVQRISFLLTDPEICYASRDSKSWNLTFQNDRFWSQLISRKGLPFVEGIDKGFKSVFLNLYRRTIGGEMYGEVRDIPRLAKEVYSKFVEQYDSFAPQEKI